MTYRSHAVGSLGTVALAFMTVAQASADPPKSPPPPTCHVDGPLQAIVSGATSEELVLSSECNSVAAIATGSLKSPADPPAPISVVSMTRDANTSQWHVRLANVPSLSATSTDSKWTLNDPTGTTVATVTTHVVALSVAPTLQVRYDEEHINDIQSGQSRTNNGAGIAVTGWGIQNTAALTVPTEIPSVSGSGLDWSVTGNTWSSNSGAIVNGCSDYVNCAIADVHQISFGVFAEQQGPLWFTLSLKGPEPGWILTLPVKVADSAAQETIPIPIQGVTKISCTGREPKWNSTDDGDQVASAGSIVAASQRDYMLGRCRLYININELTRVWADDHKPVEQPRPPPPPLTAHPGLQSPGASAGAEHDSPVFDPGLPLVSNARALSEYGRQVFVVTVHQEGSDTKNDTTTPLNFSLDTRAQHEVRSDIVAPKAPYDKSGNGAKPRGTWLAQLQDKLAAAAGSQTSEDARGKGSTGQSEPPMGASQTPVVVHSVALPDYPASGEGTFDVTIARTPDTSGAVYRKTRLTDPFQDSITFQAKIRLRGTNGFAHPFRIFATVPVNLAGIRFPASAAGLTKSSSTTVYEAFTLTAGILAAVEPWNYQLGRTLYPLSVRFETGFNLVTITSATFTPTYVLGASVNFPLVESPASVGTSLAVGTFWEVDLRERDPFKGGSHFTVTLGLNVLALGSPMGPK
jgi:hypothetical protein